MTVVFVLFADQIENVEVKAPMMPAIEGYSYNLTCNVTGPAEYIYWMKNGEILHDENRTVFYMENKTLHLSMVERYDNGNYCCMAINAFGNKASPAYNLIINCEYIRMYRMYATKWFNVNGASP